MLCQSQSSNFGSIRSQKDTFKFTAESGREVAESEIYKVLYTFVFTGHSDPFLGAKKMSGIAKIGLHGVARMQYLA